MVSYEKNYGNKFNKKFYYLQNLKKICQNEYSNGVWTSMNDIFLSPSKINLISSLNTKHKKFKHQISSLPLQTGDKRSSTKNN